MSRNLLRSAVALAWSAIGLFATSHAAAPPQRPPNVVIILTDDQGYADVGCFGSTRVATPNLDRLARRGVRLTNFHVPQAVCSASRAALLTGCYPNRVGIHGALGPNANHGLHDRETTIAEVLKARGYATGHAGKWHLGHREPFLPNRHGFDESLGLPYSNDMWPHHPEARPGTYPPLPLLEDGRVVDAEVTPQEQATLTARFTDRAVAFIERNRARPFFFYLAHAMPHVPLYAGERFQGKSGHSPYGDVIAEIDWSVGEVVAALERHGLTRDTLIIFLSDNGPWLSYGDHAGSAGPLREGKGTSWEGGTRVPCIMSWPGRIPEDAAGDEYLVSIDLFPTLAKLAGAPLPESKIDGLDVWPLIAREPGAANPHDAYGFWYAQNELQAVVSGDGRWKLLLPHRYRTLAGRPGGQGGTPAKYETAAVERPQLYDLRTDPGETKDLADAHPDVVQRLTGIADRCRDDLGDALTKRTGTGVREPGRVAPPATRPR